MKKRSLMLLLALLAGPGMADEEQPPVIRIPGRASYSAPEVVNAQRGPRETAPPAPQPAPAVRGDEVVVPVGSILAWSRAFTNMPGLPPGWVACNGQTVDDTQSPFFGQAVPNLNGHNGEEGRFLRGAPTSGGMGGKRSHTHAAYRSQKYGTQRSPVASPTPEEHLPPYYDVVWIMRIR